MDEITHIIERAKLYPTDDRPASSREHLAAQAVLADLTDRRGISQAFDDIDQEIKTEIVDQLTAIIKTVMSQG